MTTYEKIVEAVKPFGLPYAESVYKGNASKWIVYNYADIYGEVFGDDEPDIIVNSVQVHLYLPVNEPFNELMKRIRKALHAQGFTWPEIPSIDIEDEKLRHITFECDIEE